MRRACSSGVSAVSIPVRLRTKCSRLASGRGRGSRSDPPPQGGTSPSIGSPRATRSRISLDEIGTGSISNELDALGARQLPQHGLEHLAAVARTRRHAEPRALEHPFRVLPRQELRELVGADEEDRIAPAAFASRSTVRSCGSSTTSSSGNAARASCSRVVGVELDLLVTGPHRRRAPRADRTRSARAAARRARRDRSAAG